MAAISNPTTKPYVMVTFGGSQGSGADAEIWQCGVKMGFIDSAGAAQGGNLDDLTGYLTSITGGLQTWFSSAANWIRNDFHLSFIKVANIAGGALQKGGPGGIYNGSHDTHGGPNPATASMNFLGGATNTTVWPPPFCALAITWRSSLAPKGKAGSHGRIYLPMAFGTNTNRVGNTDVTNALTAGKALLTLLSKTPVVPTSGPAGGTSTLKPCLFGRDGSSYLVDQVSVGNVVDVQRRRKSALHEVYTTNSWS